MDAIDEFVFGERSETETNHYKPLDIKNYKITKPTIFVFGGMDTKTHKSANGYAKLIKNLLGKTYDNANIVSTNYNRDVREESRIRNIKNLFDSVILPLICENGHKIDTNLACKNMRKITIVAHCYGDFVAKDLLQNLSSKLEELGYSDNERKQIEKQVLLITYGINSFTNNVLYKNINVSAMNIISPKDILCFAFGESFWEHILLSDNYNFCGTDKQELKDIVEYDSFINNQKLEEFYTAHKRCYPFVVDNTICFATSPFHDTNVLNVDHSFTQIIKSDNLSDNSTADCISACISSALNYSVNASVNGELMDFDKLYNNMQAITTKFNNYQIEQENNDNLQQ